ncbi:MAG TPA: Ig-like domain-containing protein [Thermoanaerobaculia bacterium]|nr:Ig-like domain-containing protein [Thermoanaerobaculia bacterium]
MKKAKWTVAGLGLLLILAVACTTETAIKSLKLGKDKAVATETSAFATGDTVYAVAAISSSGKVKVTGRLLIDEVEGQTKGPIPGLETTIDLAKGEDGNFTFSPPPAGWPKGKYTLEVVLTDDAGAQKDKKSANFTVS